MIKINKQLAEELYNRYIKNRKFTKKKPILLFAGYGIMRKHK